MLAHPFPGMNPYLEISGDWRDFHVTFINAAREAINERLPANYLAKIDERFRIVEAPVERGRNRYPDVSVNRSGKSLTESASSVATLELEPVVVRMSRLAREEVRETWIEIRRAPDWHLVTAIEVLSPANKEEPGYTDYLIKRAEILEQPVHLVELDLLVAGRRPPTDDPLPRGDYLALVSRAEARPTTEAYAWSVRRKLPTIPIPLSRPDPDVRLDLAEVFATTFRRGRYELSIDYRQPLNLPLSAEDRAWAEGLAGGSVATSERVS